MWQVQWCATWSALCARSLATSEAERCAPTDFAPADFPHDLTDLLAVELDIAADVHARAIARTDALGAGLAEAAVVAAARADELGRLAQG